jgi:hypothetical protein
MAIIGKTDIKAIPLEVAPDVIGKNWKGSKSTGQGGSKRPGADLKNRFRLEIPQSCHGEFIQSYGSLEPEQIRIYLPYQTTDECFETWNEAYSTKGLSHRCNGERIIHEMQEVDTFRGGLKYKRPCRVDCDRPCNKPKGADICDKCVSQGRLKFYVRELFHLTGLTGIYMQTVTGINDVLGITQQLRSIEADMQDQGGSLRDSPVPSPSTMNRLPLVLSRYRKEISRPMISSGQYTGGRSRGDTFPILVSIDGEWLAHLNKYRQQQHIVLMLKQGNEALLMESDRELLKEMTAVMLPSSNRDRFVAALEGSIDEQLQLSAAEVEEIAEEIEVAIVEPEASNSDLAAAMDHCEAMKGREAQVRLIAVKKALNLDTTTLSTIKAGLDEDEDYQAAPAPERVEWYIEAMILHYGASRYSQEIAKKCLDKTREEFPILADEDLAAQFRNRLDSKVDVPLSGRPAPPTHRGVSIA